MHKHGKHGKLLPLEMITAVRCADRSVKHTLVEKVTTLFANRLTATQLVDALHTLGVPFLRGGSGVVYWAEPSVLLAGLAESDEARLRLALIPLLLTHPHFSADINIALKGLSPAAAITLRCYYTAAYWLQSKYHARIERCLDAMPSLPDLFSAELALPSDVTAEQALHLLATRQQELTGRVLNWHGTYEHALKTWLQHLELQRQWNQSPPTKLITS